MMHHPLVLYLFLEMLAQLGEDTLIYHLLWGPSYLLSRTNA